MEDATEIASLSFEIDGIRQEVADEDFRSYTRPYKSTLFGTIHLLADREEITHTNKLPAEFDLIDTVRAQYELIETFETTGVYEGVPFCCVCGDRGCSSVHWTVTQDDGSYVSISMGDLMERTIGQPPYRIPKNALYAGFYSFWTKGLEICSVRDIKAFEWADRKETPVAGRESYATTTEIQSWKSNLAELFEY